MVSSQHSFQCRNWCTLMGTNGGANCHVGMVDNLWLRERSGGVKVWLDDERPAPEGWTACRWPHQVIALLETGQVTHLSLDHDLGEDYTYPTPRTGMDVVRWLEEAVLTRGFVLPRCWVHSMNPVAAPVMLKALMRLRR